jgi:hypothetical protein
MLLKGTFQIGHIPKGANSKKGTFQKKKIPKMALPKRAHSK